MITYTISTSWGETCRFHADIADARTFMAAVQEAVYVAWEMELDDPCTCAQAAALLRTGWPLRFSYHGLEFSWLQLAGDQFSLFDE